MEAFGGGFGVVEGGVCGAGVNVEALADRVEAGEFVRGDAERTGRVGGQVGQPVVPGQSVANRGTVIIRNWLSKVGLQPPKVLPRSMSCRRAY